MSRENDTGDDGGPVAALRRIAFLLERGREETYKVKAFRSAAATILPLPADEVAAPGRGRARSPTCPASAPSTAAGDRGRRRGASCPTRLAELEREHGGPLADGRRRSCARALRGDLHSHSDWSDGGSPIEEMAFTAIELGHDYLVLTDHSPRLTVANGLSVARLTRQLGVVDAVNEHLAGDAASRCSRGSRSTSSTTARLDQTDEMLARLDVRVASVHSKLRMDARRDDPADGRRGPQPAHQRARPLHRPAGHGQPRHPRPAVGVRRRGGLRGLRRARRRGRDQLPARAPRPADELLELARDLGCLFSIDSDAHAPGQLDFLVYGCERAEALGIDPDRIVNTWPLERLLEWARPPRPRLSEV